MQLSTMPTLLSNTPINFPSPTYRPDSGIPKNMSPVSYPVSPVSSPDVTSHRCYLATVKDKICSEGALKAWYTCNTTCSTAMVVASITMVLCWLFYFYVLKEPNSGYSSYSSDPSTPDSTVFNTTDAIEMLGTHV